VIRPPECVACGEPVQELYTRDGNRATRSSWSSAGRSALAHDRGVLWLCADCVDAAARISGEVMPTTPQRNPMS